MSSPFALEGRRPAGALFAAALALTFAAPARADSPPPPLAPLAQAPQLSLPASASPRPAPLPAPLGRRVPAPDPALQKPPGWKWTGMLDITSVPSFLWFAGGALSGLTLHELGHVFSNLSYGNVPGITGILYAKFIPWFVIDPRISTRNGVYYKHDGSVFTAGAQGYYVIDTAGFMMQNAGSEIILTAKPGLLYEKAPYLKGMLWMNIILSLGYATASLIGTEDPHGDIYGAAQHSQYPHQLVAGMIFANGAFDMLRYLIPDTEFLPWISRTSKAMIFGMDVPFR